MNYISFSLFGDDPKYHVGAIANVRLAEEFYPFWRLVYYVGQTSLPTGKMLESLGADVRWMPDDDRGLYWRMQLAEELHDQDRCLFRDTDSRISLREAEAVQAWIDSGKQFHLMRDHPRHGSKVMQGMIGVKGRSLAGIMELLADCENKRGGANDVFDALYDRVIRESAIEHGEFRMEEFPDQIPFPRPRVGNRFVGEIFDAENNPNNDWEELLP